MIHKEVLGTCGSLCETGNLLCWRFISRDTAEGDFELKLLGHGNCFLSVIVPVATVQLFSAFQIFIWKAKREGNEDTEIQREGEGEKEIFHELAYYSTCLPQLAGRWGLRLNFLCVVWVAGTQCLSHQPTSLQRAEVLLEPRRSSMGSRHPQMAVLTTVRMPALMCICKIRWYISDSLHPGLPLR